VICVHGPRRAAVCSTNDDARLCGYSCEQEAQTARGQCHAAGGRQKARPRHVKENRAAAARDTGPGVVIDLNDEIVKMISPL
jgi:hypothetical protein